MSGLRKKGFATTRRPKQKYAHWNSETFVEISSCMGALGFGMLRLHRYCCLHLDLAEPLIFNCSNSRPSVILTAAFNAGLLFTARKRERGKQRERERERKKE